jgi:hypothetical protein
VTAAAAAGGSRKSTTVTANPGKRIALARTCHADLP